MNDTDTITRPHLPSVALGILAAGAALLIAGLATSMGTGGPGPQPTTATVAAALAIAGLALGMVSAAVYVFHHLDRP